VLSEPRGWPERSSTTAGRGLHVVVLDGYAERRINLSIPRVFLAACGCVEDGRGERATQRKRGWV
jgi:hypothetical protein